MSKRRKLSRRDFSCDGDWKFWCQEQRQRRAQPSATPGARVVPRTSWRNGPNAPTAPADPLSDIIGISALIDSAIGAGAVAGGVGAAVGGFVVAGTLSIPASLSASLLEPTP
jgi:hypothetical protein